ncbi:hypothetical protein E1B28_013005 [Marasmius oreades]|uniref:Uncharacterized protein n=1 Tax=Marasmius oreades TaxID=181124 RepID=A0A9P7RNS2_9AGAR|nr:uncharacterized protein E1B28_013005 [Marasmius oreades]KAG7087026.1 hypothetical protein E1B28_013005 [Marasmius oreades]
MSLPAAPKDTTTSPAKGAVFDPVNKELKDKDVDRKLSLYTTLLALRSSKLPTNAQLDAYLKYWKDLQATSADPKASQLSKDGQKLVRDVQDILETLRVLVAEKNHDELIQEFVWGTRSLSDDVSSAADTTTTTTTNGAKVPVTKDKARQDGQTAVQHLRTLLTLLFTNSEARKLVSDFGMVGRDLLSKTLVKAATNIAPNEEKLKGVDEPHRGEQQFIPKEQLEKEKEDAKQKLEAARRTGEEKKEQAANATLDEVNKAEQQADAARENDETIPKSTSGEMTTQTKKKGLMERMVGGVKESIPGEHQDKAKGHLNRGREFLTEEYFPEDRRDQWIWRVKKVIIECQQHPEYQQSLEWIIGFVKEYATHGRTMGSQHVETSKNAAPSSIFTALQQLKIIAERFASNKSFDKLILDPVGAMIDDGKRDPELERWWKEIADYMEKCVKEPGYIMEPSCESRARELQDQGRVFFGDERPGEAKDVIEGGVEGQLVQTEEARGKGKYREHLDHVIDGVMEFVKGVGEDKGNKRLGTDVQRLTKDLLFDGDNLAFKKQLWNDIRGVILPAMINEFGYIPIPRIEYTDEAADLVVENLTLSGRNLFPNVIEVEMKNWLRWETFDKQDKSKDPHHSKDNSHHKFHLHLTQIQADMRDVLFYFNKKGGAIKIKDSGVADLVLGGEGMSVDVQLQNSKDPGRLFDIQKVAVKIEGSLKVSIRDTKHDMLYKTLKPLMMGLVKKQIQKAAEGGIKSGLEWVSEELMAVKDRMEEAAKRAASDPESAGEEVGRFKALQEAFKRSPSLSSRDASVSTSHSQFKVVSNKRNSILGDAAHAGGWVSKVAEKEKLIEKSDSGGGTWKSEVFDLEANTRA